jgi:hypothetical protein
MTTPEPFISTRDMVAEIRDDVKKLSHKMNTASTVIAANQQTAIDHEQRLRVVEHSQIRIGGMGTLAVVLLGASAGLIGLVIGVTSLLVGG